MPKPFFELPRLQSKTKSLLVTEYFVSWASIMANEVPKWGKPDWKLGYIDLFSGPGVYGNGDESTPVLVMKKILANAKFTERIAPFFCEADSAHLKKLKACISDLAGIKSLRHLPEFFDEEVDTDFANELMRIKYPSFMFVDPFGYKGLSVKLINSILKNTGSDCIFFFNTAWINRLIENGQLGFHLDNILGAQHAQKIRQLVTIDMKPLQREITLIDTLVAAMKESYRDLHVEPFRFRNPSNTRTTHHLIQATKHPKGNELMKKLKKKYGKASLQINDYEYVPSEFNQGHLFGTQ